MRHVIVRFSFAISCLCSTVYAVPPLITATLSGNPASVQNLLAQGVDPNIAVNAADLASLPPDVQLGDTALHIAARRGLLDIANTILRAPHLERLYDRSGLAPRPPTPPRPTTPPPTPLTDLGLGLGIPAHDPFASLRGSAFGHLGMLTDMCETLIGMDGDDEESSNLAALAPDSQVIYTTNPVAVNAAGLTPMYGAILEGHVELVHLLGANDGAHGLTTLNFSQLTVPANFVPALVAALGYAAPSLTTLSLQNLSQGASSSLFGSTNPLHAANVMAFNALAVTPFPLLTTLILTGAQIGQAGFTTLSPIFAALLPQLMTLGLGNNNLQDGGLHHLALLMGGPHSPAQLTSLDVHSNLASEIGAQSLAGAFASLPALQIFDYSGNQLGPGGLEHFATSLLGETTASGGPVLPNLTSFDLTNTNLFEPAQDEDGVDPDMDNRDLLQKLRRHRPVCRFNTEPDPDARALAEGA